MIIMDLKKKRKVELENQKEKRKKEVILLAIEVLKEKGIENTKMTDIAEKSQVGVATVYRYFKTKPDLVIEAAIVLWEIEINSLHNQFYEGSFLELSGAERVRIILSTFITLYHKHSEFIRFLEQFDNYIIKEHIDPEKLENYEKGIIDMKPVMFDAIDKGKKDGSIKGNVDKNVFYITITHSLMSLCQKLILRGEILRSDREIKGDTQVEFLIEMAMNYICTSSLNNN
jgi:AcrR family transcriptional regulator